MELSTLKIKIRVQSELSLMSGKLQYSILFWAKPVIDNFPNVSIVAPIIMIVKKLEQVT